MSPERLNYAKLLREVLPVHLLDAPLRRVVDEALAGGESEALHAVCVLALEALCAKGHFARAVPERSPDGTLVFFDRRSLSRFALLPPTAPASRYGVTLRPMLPPDFANETSRGELEAALTGVSKAPTEDELADSLRRIADFVTRSFSSSRLLYVHLAERSPSVPFEPLDASVLAASFPDHFRSGGDPLAVPDLAEDPRLRGRAEREGVRSAVAFPLRAGDETFGVMEALHPEPGAFDEVAIGVLSLLALLAAGRIRSAKRYEKMISIDPLTGVFTRRFFEEQILRELERANRDNTALALVMVDLDNFKEVNDRFGHPVGDAVLASVAEILRDHVRRIDLVTRYGGEEFAILLPGASRAQAKVICERLRSLVETAPVPSGNAGGFRLTTSIGIALHPDNTTARLETHDVRSELLERADQALYEAKRTGKNRVIFWKEERRA